MVRGITERRDGGTVRRYRAPMSPMPEPGEVCPGFISEANRCWRTVYDHNLQANHCAESPAWTGRWFSPRGDKWWLVWACPDHLERLTGLPEFGRSRRR